MKRAKVSRWVLAHPIWVALALTLVGAIATAIDYGVTSKLSDYRNVVWNGDYAIEWPVFEWPIYVEASRVAVYIIETSLIVLVPLIAFATSIFPKVRRDGSAGLATQSADDTVVAMTCVHLIHTELENPLAQILGTIDETRLNERVLVDPESGQQIRAYTRHDVQQYLTAVQHHVSPRLERVRAFTEEFSPNNDRSRFWGSERGPFLEILYEMLGDSARREEQTSISERFRWGSDPTPRSNAPLIDLRVQPANYRIRPDGRHRVYADVPDSIVRIPVFEAIRNALRAVERRKQELGTSSLPVESPELWITVYVTYDVIWVYVNDTGPGLDRTHSELAELGVSFHPSGRGMGLYVCEALSRIGACRYYLDNALEGGAVARIMFNRDRRTVNS